MSCYLRGLVSIGVLAILSGCGGPSGASSSSFPTQPDRVPAGLASGVMVGAGDIASCTTPNPAAESTAMLLDRIDGTVFTAGDNAYNTPGHADPFQSCYAPTWGRHLARTRPVAGNHEYEVPGAATYFQYFGDRAGPAGLGYYSYAVGPWTVIALNSEIPSGPASPQLQWLRSELTSHPTSCTAVIWHRPLFSSGRNGDNPDMIDVWRALYDLNVEIVINGHDHSYERFAQQDPDGRPDPARGIREFVVGTGGAPLYEFPRVRANSEVRSATWGVVRFTLATGSYSWEFVPVDGSSFHDSGTGTCH
jgi:calcineurin-like phosphoesterase family protein